MSFRPIGMPCSGPRQRLATISASAERAAASASSLSTRIKLLSLPSSRLMRSRRLCTSSTGESSRLLIRALASAIVRNSGTMRLSTRRREDVRRFGADFALDPHARGYFLDEMGRGGDLGLLALRDFEPGAGERRLDLCTGHALGFHDAVFQSLRCRGLILAETAALRNRNHYCRRPDEEK